MNRALHARLAKLERQARPGGDSAVTEIRFGLWLDRLPEGTVVPEGAHVVQDFHYHPELASEEWGRPRFRNGFFVERVTFDPSDQGREVTLREAA